MITSNNGQIRRGSKKGESLYNLAKQRDILNIVDIGTWKGMGSTKCILDAILESNKTNYNVFSIESNKLFHEEAKINLGFLPRNFYLLHGSLISADILKQKKSEPEINLDWIEEDIQNILTSENIFDRLPEEIDLLIIDGGEYSGEIEFNVLWERSKYFFLDDIISYKNKNNRKYILSNPDVFSIIEDDVINNFLICKNLKK